MRLRDGDVVFELCVQRFVDEHRTPIEDGSVEWMATVTPPVLVATLRIPAQDVGSVDAAAAARQVDQLVFNPWNTTEEFRPLGNLNRARKAAYAASGAQRLGFSFTPHEPLRNTLLGIPVRAVFTAVNRYIPWHKLPLDLSLLNLAMLRRSCAAGTSSTPRCARRRRWRVPVPPPSTSRCGSGAPTTAPTTTSPPRRWGRSARPSGGISSPSTGRSCSTRRTRDRQQAAARTRTFLPARSLNVLAAAWIQFQVHDWVDHARYPPGTEIVEVPLPTA